MKRGIHKIAKATWAICYDGIALESDDYLTLEAAQLAWSERHLTGGEFDELLAMERRYD